MSKVRSKERKFLLDVPRPNGNDTVPEASDSPSSIKGSFELLSGQSVVTDLSSREDKSADASPAHLFLQDAPTVILPIASIDPDPEQPRKTFKPEYIEELGRSIKEDGLLQPILVRPNDLVDGRYLIVAGECRWRACKGIARTTIECKIRRVSAATAFRLALIENVQRDSLLPLEEAQAYAHLMETQSLNQSDLARQLGVDRRRVSEKLSLLQLPNATQSFLSSRADTFSERHGLLLASAPEHVNVELLAERCVAEGWSTRRLEQKLSDLRNTIRPVPLLPEQPKFQNVRLELRQRGGFNLVARARNVNEVESTITELEQVIASLRKTLLMKYPQAVP